MNNFYQIFKILKILRRIKRLCEGKTMENKKEFTGKLYTIYLKDKK